MIKRIVGLMLAAALVLCAVWLPAAAFAGAVEVASSEPSDPDPTEEPTPAPTPEPTTAPTETPTDPPIVTPVPATQTPKPTNTPKPTAAPSNAPTNAPTSAPTTAPGIPTLAPTTAPATQQPTQQPSYIAYPLWESAADTIIPVTPGEYFDVKLIEGASEYVSFSNFYGNLPVTVTLDNQLDTDGSCSVSGSVNTAGLYEFAIEFNTRSGRKLMLNFCIRSQEEQQPDPNAFPEAYPLIPFGGSPSAALPAVRRKEDA